MRSRLKFLLKCFAATIVITVIAGVVYEQLGRRSDKRRFPQIGRSVDIGGRTLNIFCSGEGAPTVVLEGEVGFRWTPIQREVARFTRACWYDRAGYGWSDPAPRARTAAAMANDLRALLRAASESPPYVLVGASGDAFPVRVFAGKYPDDAAGLVLVDPRHEDYREPDSDLGWANRLPAPVRGALLNVVPAAHGVGLIRLTGRTSRPSNPDHRPEGMTPEDARYLHFLYRLPKTVVADADEGRHLPASGEEARAAGHFGNRPLIVLTAGKLRVPPDPRDLPDIQAFHQRKLHEWHPQLARLSSRGRQIILHDSAHGIQFEARPALVDAIRQVLDDSRAAQLR